MLKNYIAAKLRILSLVILHPDNINTPNNNNNNLIFFIFIIPSFILLTILILLYFYFFVNNIDKKNFILYN